MQLQSLTDSKLFGWLGSLGRHSEAGGRERAHWDWDQLTGCLPRPLRRALAGNVCLVAVEPTGALVELFKETDEGRFHVGTFESGSLDEAKALVDSIKAQPKTIQLRLPASRVLKKRVSFPLGVEENLRKVLGFELDRLTPFSAEEARYDYRVLERRRAAQKLEVELAVVPRQGFEHFLEALRRVGLEPDSVRPAGAWPEADLLSPGERKKKGWSRSKLNWLLVICVLALLSVALMAPLWHKRQVVMELNRHLTSVRAQTEEILVLREKLDKETQAATYVLDKRRTTPPLMDVLDELTKLFPDDTWVQQLDLRQGNLQIRGESAQATALIGKLEGSQFFRDAGFRSPLVQVANKEAERFHLSAYVEPRQ